jgi:hypothetical protein
MLFAFAGTPKKAPQETCGFSGTPKKSPHKCCSHLQGPRLAL